MKLKIYPCLASRLTSVNPSISLVLGFNKELNICPQGGPHPAYSYVRDGCIETPGVTVSPRIGGGDGEGVDGSGMLRLDPFWPWQCTDLVLYGMGLAQSLSRGSKVDSLGRRIMLLGFQVRFQQLHYVLSLISQFRVCSRRYSTAGSFYRRNRRF